MPKLSVHGGKSAKLSAEMQAVETFSSLHLVSFLVLTLCDLIDVSVPLHPRQERTKEEAQLASKTPSRR